jgi:hypothetical protein
VNSTDPFPRNPSELSRRHLRFAWWTLLAYLSLGVALEMLHAFKYAGYLNVGMETRRLMWTLAHAHGTLIGLVHAAFAQAMQNLEETRRSRGPRVASYCLIAATVLLPGGFFLGGVSVYSGDPGLGALLIPLGAACLFVAVLLTALDVTRRE